MSFKDYFSQQSNLYVKYRPQYPPEFFAYIASLSPEHTLAWDCGTGNGQAAVGLASFYNQVIATDASEAQIKNAFVHDKILYKVEKAEHTSLDPGTVDLVLVANAIHWFDFDSFYTEVRRVLKKDGIMVASAYGTPSISPEVDKIIFYYHDVVLKEYWLPENRLVEHKYADLPFPFEQQEVPDFIYQVTMNLHEVIGYLNTWSATQRFINKNQVNPTEEVYQQLQEVWGETEEEKILTWELILKVGKV